MLGHNSELPFNPACDSILKRARPPLQNYAEPNDGTVVNLSSLLADASFMTFTSTNASLRLADRVSLPAQRPHAQSTKADLS
jgi:hypothetical protein